MFYVMFYCWWQVYHLYAQLSVVRIKATHVASSTFNTQVKPIYREGQAKGYGYSLFQDSITTIFLTVMSLILQSYCPFFNSNWQIYSP